MKNQDLYSFDDSETLKMQVSELDDFIGTHNNNDDNNKSDDQLVSFDPDITVLKEEPVLSALDDSVNINNTEDEIIVIDEDAGETLSPDTLPEVQEEKKVSGKSGEYSDEVLFTDEKQKDDIFDTGVKRIIVDDETEKAVQEKLVIDEGMNGVIKDSEKSDEVLFTDEEDSRSEILDDDSAQIIADDETEQFVKEQISRHTIESKSEIKIPEEAGFAIEQPADEKESFSPEEPMVEDLPLTGEESLDQASTSLEEIPTSDTEAEDILIDSSAGGESSSFFDEVDDEKISLSNDEISNILQDADNIEEQEVPTIDSVLQEKSENDFSELSSGAEETRGGFGFEGTESRGEESEFKDFNETEEENLELTVEKDSAELDELEQASSASFLNEEPVRELEEDFPIQQKNQESAGSSTFFDDMDEDESISLTGNELDNILQDAEVVEASSNKPVSGEGTGEMEEMVGEEETLDNVPAPPDSGFLEEIDKKSLKNMIKYLDNLLDNLPEDKIKEFAESEYYDLYNKLLDSLEI